MSMHDAVVSKDLKVYIYILALFGYHKYIYIRSNNSGWKGFSPFVKTTCGGGWKQTPHCDWIQVSFPFDQWH